MADKIRGITIELNGDSTGLMKAVKQVNGSLRQTQAALKDVNKLLKLDPGNTTLLAQKQDYLKKAISDTSKKLEEEKKVLEELKKSGDSDKTVEQQRALERQIAETTQRLDGLKQEAKEFGSVATQQFKLVGDKIKDVGKGITDVGKGMTTHVTAPIMAVGAASMAAFSEVDAAMDTIVVKTGASGKALEDMQAIVGNLATSIPVSFEEAGTAVGEVNTRFGVTGEELEKLSGKFLKFAQINGTDVNSTIDATQKSMAAWGIQADQTGEYLDTLNKVGQNTGISMDTLNSAMASNAETFQQMGMGAADAATFLGQVEMSGVDTSAALKGMQTAMKNAAKEGKSLPEALAELQTVMTGSASDTDKLNAAIEFFGAKAGPQMFNAMQNGTVSLNDFGAALTDNFGSVEQTFDATLDPVDEMTTAMNDLKLAGAGLGESLQSVLAPVLEQVADKIRDLREWWEWLSPAMQETIVKVGLVAAAIGPLLVIIGTVISTISTIVGAIGGAIGIFSTLSAAFTAAGGAAGIFTAAIAVITGPIGIAVAAVAALIAIGVALYKNWDEVKAKAAELAQAISEKWEEIKKVVSDAIENVKTTVSNGIDAAKQKVETTLDGIRQAFKDKLDAAKKVVTDTVDGIKKAFNFEWKLPDLKLPHIKYELKDVPVLGRIPDPTTLRVEWYKKAMQNGMILNGATIFGAANGRLLGGGEAGAEAVVGVNSLMSMIKSAVGETINYGGVNVVVYGAPGQDVEELADIISDRINAQVASRKAVFA